MNKLILTATLLSLMTACSKTPEHDASSSAETVTYLRNNKPKPTMLLMIKPRNVRRKRLRLHMTAMTQTVFTPVQKTLISPHRN